MRGGGNEWDRERQLLRTIHFEVYSLSDGRGRDESDGN